VAINVASGRTGISAVILESPIADYEHAIAAQTARLGLPGGLLLRAATAVAQAISGSDFKSVRPVDHLKNLKCPALAIVGADDELLRPADIRQLKEATQSIPNSIFWLIENAGHLQAISVAPMEYERQVRRFLNSILNSREF
jgi:pimeloyl-ACP methyl ester carboxylesterase